MPTARPFARNTGAPIAGTEQVGNLAVGIPTAGFAATGLPWWNGPDEDLGYVIATQVPANNQPTPVPENIVTSGLTLYLDAGDGSSYPGSGSTWYDLSGNGNNGTIVGATFNSANGGIFVFNNPTSVGSNQYVTMGANFVGQPTAFTVNHFIYLEASQSQRTIFSNYEFPSNSGWVTGISDSTNNVLKFYLGSATLFSSTTLSNQVWYNVTITYDSGNPKIYINGVLDASSSNTINYVAGNTLNNEIGRLSGLAFQYFYGSIGIAMYYNRALSATEITQNFNAQKSRFGL